MQLKYIKGSKFFQRHWIVNTVIGEAKKAGVFRRVCYGDVDPLIRPRVQKEMNKLIYRRRMWEFAQPFIDNCMEEFEIPYVRFVRGSEDLLYYGRKGQERLGFFGKQISKSEYRVVYFQPHLHEIYGLIKQIFKQHYDGKRV